MTTRFYEFLHVSELLETVFGGSILLLVAAQFLVTRHQLWVQIEQIKEQDVDEQEKWYEKEMIRRGINAEVPEVTDGDNSMVRNVQEELNPHHTEEPERQGDTVDAPAQQIMLENTPEVTKKTDRFEGLTSSKRQSLQMFEEINEIFNRHVPIVMCCMVLAIMTESTFIISAITFFCFLFFNMVFNYAKLVEKLEMKIENKAVPMILQLMANCFIIVFFVGILIRTEFLE